MKELRITSLQDDLIGNIKLTDSWLDSIKHNPEALFLVPVCRVSGKEVELLSFTLVAQPSQEAPKVEFRDLTQIISFKDFVYDHTYKTQEKSLLQPQLESLGYTDCEWGPGETDSFGPLTRVCKARNKDGQLIHFVYG